MRIFKVCSVDAGSTIKLKGLPREGWPFSLDSSIRAGLGSPSGTDAGSSRTGNSACALFPACETARACRRERALQGRFRPAPSSTRGRMISGPLFRRRSPRHAGFGPSVLRVQDWQDARHPPLPGPVPSLFSVWPASKRLPLTSGARSCQILPSHLTCRHDHDEHFPARCSEVLRG